MAVIHRSRCMVWANPLKQQKVCYECKPFRSGHGAFIFWMTPSATRLTLSTMGLFGCARSAAIPTSPASAGRTRTSKLNRLLWSISVTTASTHSAPSTRVLHSTFLGRCAWVKSGKTREIHRGVLFATCTFAARGEVRNNALQIHRESELRERLSQHPFEVG